MEIGINNQLSKVASRLIFRKGLESANLNRTLKGLETKLQKHFGDKLEQIIIFGSYARETMLSHYIDQNSDVDLLIVFKHDNGRLTTSSYRDRLTKFAESAYPDAYSFKDSPSIIIDLPHITLDLVATVFDKGVIYDSFEIPGDNGGWRETDPKEFTELLIKRNKEYGFIVKPLIRLMKYWNATHNRPFKSYDLEQEIVDMSFQGDNLQSGFFYIFEQLDKKPRTNVAQAKITSACRNIEIISDCLEKGNLTKAKQGLTHILPRFP